MPKLSSDRIHGPTRFGKALNLIFPKISQTSISVEHCWLTAFWVIHWLAKNNTVWLTLLSGNRPTHEMIFKCMAVLSVMQFDWLSNWLYCQRTDQPTEWLYSWLTDWITDFADLWLINNYWLPDRLRVYLVIYWLTKILCDWLYCPWLTKTLNDLQMYLWLIDWKTDCTVRRLTNWLNNLWLADYMTS